MFYHPTRELWCVVHGDDFVFTGFQEDLDFALGVMKKDYDIKSRGFPGPSKGDVKEIDILGRALKYTEAGITWQADPRHRKMILEHFWFQQANQILDGKRC